jgi:hypothetical protein
MELTQKDVYDQEIKRGKSHIEALNTIIDFWSNGLSASWSDNKWQEARKIVEKNISN